VTGFYTYPEHTPIMPSASASSGSRTPAGVVFTSQNTVCSAVWPSSKVTRTRRSLTVALLFNCTPACASRVWESLIPTGGAGGTARRMPHAISSIALAANLTAAPALSSGYPQFAVQLCVVLRLDFGHCE
jgi:hypothetical protein